MNNYKITFSNLRDITDSLEKDRIDIFIDYINSFKGDNILEKFKSFLTSWKDDVNPYLTFRVDSEKKNIPISYLLKECLDISSPTIIEFEGTTHELGIPDVFYESTDVIPIYTILKKSTLNPRQYINWNTLSLKERQTNIDMFPPLLFNEILSTIWKDSSKILKWNHPSLSTFSLNFYTNEPLNFIKSMFLPYDAFYFRDIVYHLSGKIGPNLQNSTLQDIEYYLKKMSAEMETETPVKI